MTGAVPPPVTTVTAAAGTGLGGAAPTRDSDPTSAGASLQTDPFGANLKIMNLNDLQVSSNCLNSLAGGGLTRRSTVGLTRACGAVLSPAVCVNFFTTKI